MLHLFLRLSFVVILSLCSRFAFFVVVLSLCCHFVFLCLFCISFKFFCTLCCHLLSLQFCMYISGCVMYFVVILRFCLVILHVFVFICCVFVAILHPWLHSASICLFVNIFSGHFASTLKSFCVFIVVLHVRWLFTPPCQFAALLRSLSLCSLFFW